MIRKFVLVALAILPLLSLSFTVATSQEPVAVEQSKTNTSNKDRLETPLKNEKEIKSQENVIKSMPLKAVQLEGETRKNHNSWYIDISAALFGWLAVIFALVSVGSIIYGVKSIRQIRQNLEKELKEKALSELQNQASQITDTILREKFNTILGEELKSRLKEVRTLVNSEIEKTMDGSEVRQGVIDQIVDEIRAKSVSSSATFVNHEEFEN